MPEELLGTGDASYAEWAVYTALTLYACHRQGNDKPMHQKNISVGRAAARLVKSDEDEARILNRLNLVVTAISPGDISYYLRSIVQLLSGEAIALDYARLAKELYLMNYEETANAVKLRWGRDFYNERYNNTNNDNGKEKEKNNG